MTDSNSFDSEEEKRWRRKTRAMACRKCGALSVKQLPGSDRSLDQATHFADVIYKVCGSCGYEEPVKPRKGQAKKGW